MFEYKIIDDGEHDKRPPSSGVGWPDSVNDLNDLASPEGGGWELTAVKEYKNRYGSVCYRWYFKRERVGQ